MFALEVLVRESALLIFLLRTNKLDCAAECFAKGEEHSKSQLNRLLINGYKGTLWLERRLIEVEHD